MADTHLHTLRADDAEGMLFLSTTVPIDNYMDEHLLPPPFPPTGTSMAADFQGRRRLYGEEARRIVKAFEQHMPEMLIEALCTALLFRKQAPHASSEEEETSL